MRIREDLKVFCDLMKNYPEAFSTCGYRLTHKDSKENIWIANGLCSYGWESPWNDFTLREQFYFHKHYKKWKRYNQDKAINVRVSKLLKKEV